jgi:hypothetical protein
MSGFLRAARPGIIGWAQVNGYWTESKVPIVMQRRTECLCTTQKTELFMLDMKIVVMALFGGNDIQIEYPLAGAVFTASKIAGSFDYPSTDGSQTPAGFTLF